MIYCGIHQLVYFHFFSNNEVQLVYEKHSKEWHIVYYCITNNKEISAIIASLFGKYGFVLISVKLKICTIIPSIAQMDKGAPPG